MIEILTRPRKTPPPRFAKAIIQRTPLVRNVEDALKGCRFMKMR